MESLTEKVLEFQKTGAGLNALVDVLAPRVYQFPRRKMGWDEDACGDFYLYFQPRLLRLLGRFQDLGKPFESYLCAVLGWQLRNFARERRRGERKWSATLRLDTADPVRESAPEDERVRSYPRLTPQVLAVIRTGADRRNFLFLLLKCARHIDREKAEALAPLTSVPAAKMLALASSLAESRAHRDRRLAIFVERRNRAFCLARLLEGELRFETDPCRRQEMERRLASANKRMAMAMTRMSRVAVAPTNREIAESLGVPKGTVDSGLC
ncbi:MAG: hypothetical protein NT005_12325, partial [Spirochaetes bacterium]|nr:hypothetical protein [Spirochaetota bacterium]